MNERTNPDRTGRMEHLAPGVPVAAKLMLLLGLAGGLFVTIVLSFAAPDWQYAGIGLGAVLGSLGALAIVLRAKRANPASD